MAQRMRHMQRQQMRQARNLVTRIENLIEGQENAIGVGQAR
jgi:hypothetical protein